MNSPDKHSNTDQAVRLARANRSAAWLGSAYDALRVSDSAGKHLGTIKAPRLPANFAWGDEDGKTLYMTARTALYKMRLNIAGVRP